MQRIHLPLPAHQDIRAARAPVPVDGVQPAGLDGGVGAVVQITALAEPAVKAPALALSVAEQDEVRLLLQ